MKNLFTRFKYQIQADFYNLMDKKAAKNPISLLNQYIREAEAKTKETGKLLERQGQLKVELEKQLQQSQEMLTKRTEQLALATAANEEDLIAFAEQEVDAYTSRQSVLISSIEQADQAYFELERKYELMKHKIKDMKVRQLQLMSKENVTRAHHQMDKVISANEHSDAEFDNLNDYIEGLATKIDRQYEMTTFESRLEQLEKANAIQTAK